MKRITQGFVLIEMIIYIGLFSILIGGIIVSAFNLIQNTYRTDAQVVTHEEVNFVLKKLNWALVGAENISVNSSHDTLTIDNPKVSSDDIVFKYNSTDKKMELKTKNADGFYPITTINVSVESVIFNKKETTGQPPGVEIKLNIDGKTVDVTKYLKYVP